MQVVILSQVLACDATLGYEDYCNVQVFRFNGTPVKNLKHLTELVSICKEEYMRFDLAYQVHSIFLHLFFVAVDSIVRYWSCICCKVLSGTQSQSKRPSH